MFSRLNLAFSKLLIRPTQFYQPVQCLHVTDVNPAARKGTREKARKLKLKNELKKAGGSKKKIRKKALGPSKHIDDSWKAIPTDNVYPGRYYRWRLYGIEEAINCHKETHHPTMYNVPDAPLNISIELNMQGEKKTKMVSAFQKMAMIKYPFEFKQERNIIAFTKDVEQQKAALDAGAITAGGSDIIRAIQKGEIRISDYEFVIAHPNIMADLVALRGLLKRKFPNPKAETLGVDVPQMVARFMGGLSYKVEKDLNQEDFGVINTPIGTLNMPVEYLKDNILTILSSVNTARPKREGKFITRAILSSPPSSETLKLDPKEFPFEYELSKKKEADSDDEEDEEASQAIKQN